MNILIIHVHPEPKSFTSALKEVAVEHFQSRGDIVKVKDLFQMNFNPIASVNDFKSLSNPVYFSVMKEQMSASKTDNFSDDLKQEMDDLVWADFVLFNFPLWWSSVPAILKGWFDRVMALGFSYHPREKLYETGVFRNKKAMCCITTGGSQEAYSTGGANGNIEEVLYHLTHGILYYNGMQVLPSFYSWKAHLVDKPTLEHYLEDYKKHLQNLENFKALY